MTSEQLDRLYQEADADLVAQSRALTERAVAQIHASIDAAFDHFRRVVREEDGFGRPHVFMFVEEKDGAA